MKVTMLLADAAQAVGGKLYVLGGGWSMTGPEPTPSAIAIKLEVPWDLANRPHELGLALLDDDGRPVVVGDKPVQIQGRFEVGRPAGLPAGTPLDAVLALTMGPIPLEGGQRYTWKLSIDGESREDWHVAFMVRKGQPQPGLPFG
jgi:hypothetical protein